MEPEDDSFGAVFGEQQRDEQFAFDDRLRGPQIERGQEFVRARDVCGRADDVIQAGEAGEQMPTWSSRVMSAAKTCNVAGFPSACRAPASLASSRPTIVTRAPVSRHRFASAKPIPELPPMI